RPAADRDCDRPAVRHPAGRGRAHRDHLRLAGCGPPAGGLDRLAGLPGCAGGRASALGVFHRHQPDHRPPLCLRRSPHSVRLTVMALTTASAVEGPVVELAVVTTAGSRVWERLRTHPSAMVGISILTLYVLASLLGPLVFRWNPIHQTLSDAFLAASSGHPLGTDDLGRDELVRLMFGARYTLALGFAAVAIGLAIGVPVGAVSGYFGGWIDLLSQRVTDVVLAFPNILLALALVAVLGVGLTNVIFAVAITSIPIFIRLTRASALSIRELPYVEAARALGVPSAAILLRHVIPNSLAPVIVQASLQLGAPTLLP